MNILSLKKKQNKGNKEHEKNLSKNFVITEERANIHSLLVKAIIAISILFLLSLAFLYVSMSKKIEEQESKIFVVKEDKIYHAELENSEKLSRSSSEYYNHLKTFMFNMFSYNKHNFDDRVGMALELVSKNDGKTLYDALIKGSTKERLVNTNAFTEVVIDSIRINTNVNPIIGEVFFVQRTIYDEKKADKTYHLKCNFREVDRSISNGYGLQVYNLNYFDYQR